MGAFVFMASYVLHFMAYKKGLHISDLSLIEDSGIDSYKVTDKTPKTGNTLVDKWIDMGGGYYGIVALIKLILIELGQFKDFVKNWPGLAEFIDQLGIGWLVSFLIDQVKNFVAAIIWPVDYLSNFNLIEIAIFIMLTYFLYAWSRDLARKRMQAQETD